MEAAVLNVDIATGDLSRDHTWGTVIIHATEWLPWALLHEVETFRDIYVGII